MRALLVGHIGAHRESADLGGDALARRTVELGDHDLGALFRETVRIGPADTVAAAGDDRNAAFQSLHRGKYSGSPSPN